MPSCLRAASPTLARSVSFLTASSGRSKVILTGSAGLRGQVWSLTHFFSVEFSRSRIGLSKCVFNKRTIKVHKKLHLARHTRRRPCLSVVPESTHKGSQGPLKGATSVLQALQGSETETRELLRGTEENSVSPTRGH